MNDLRLHFIVSLLLTALLFGCASHSAKKIVEQGGKKLSASEIQTVVSGNTLKFEEQQDAAVIEMYENGSLLAWRDERDKNKGRWSTDEKDRLCIKFKYRKWGSGDEVCYDVYQFDDGYRQYTKGGMLASRFTVKEGTSRGLPSGPSKSQAKKQRGTETTATSSSTPGRRQAITKSTPTIQEVPIIPPSYDPNAQKDLRLIYREMSKDCPGCNLTNIDLEGASLMGANLAGANLSGSNLSNVNLKRANLKGATLVRTNLKGANLSGADLAGADLTDADLTDANLTRANLKGADLTRTEGIDLSNAIR